MPAARLAALAAILAATPPGPGTSPAATAPPAPGDAPAAVPLDDGTSLLSRTLEPFHGDLPEIWRRAQLRVLVPYSHTEFYVSRGKPGGYDYEMALRFQEWLNQRRPREAATLSIIFAPTPVEELLPDLLAGKGDIAAGLLTVTPERQREVAFARPRITKVDQVIVRHRDAEPLQSPDELSGRAVHVLAGSSQAEHLRALSDRLVARGRAPVRVVELPSPASREDLLHMLDAGTFSYAAMDRFLAEAWSQVFTEVKVEEAVKIATDGQIAWALRPGNPALLAAVNGFVSQRSKEAQATSAVIFRRYYQSGKRLLNAVGPSQLEQLRDLATLFREAGDRYGFDWLLLGAQALQESQFDRKARNPSGAVGLMQVLPRTGEQMGYPDVESPRSNVLAGAAYMNYLRQTFFEDAALDPAERIYFSLAAYNAGPHLIRDLRSRAKRMGLDPGRWFGQVEVVAQHVIGDETVEYVANINRYYLAYRLSSEVILPVPGAGK